MTESQFNQLRKLIDERCSAIEASGEPWINSEPYMGYKRFTSQWVITGTWDLTAHIEVYAQSNHQQDLREILQAVGLNNELEVTVNQVKAIFYRSI